MTFFILDVLFALNVLENVMLQKIIDFIAKLFGFKRKPQTQKKSSTDDIYPMW